MVSRGEIDWDNKTPTSGASSFAISKGENGEAVMIVDGNVYAFTSAERLDEEGNLYGYDNSQASGFNDTKHMRRFLVRRRDC